MREKRREKSVNKCPRGQCCCKSETTSTLYLFGGAETASALLVHLGPGCDTIDSHKEGALRADDVEEMINVGENLSKDLLLSDAEERIDVVGMRAVVDDAVHVQIEVVCAPICE